MTYKNGSYSWESIIQEFPRMRQLHNFFIENWRTGGSPAALQTTTFGKVLARVVTRYNP